MPTTFTDNLGLSKPEVGASRDTWGTLLNGDLDAIDQAVSMSMPIGAVLDFAGPSAPPGWLVCDGRLISRTTYSDLFATVGTYWGAGDGSTTFALPNSPGRSSVGPGTVTDTNGNQLTFSFAQVTGAVLQQIQQTHLPNINLTVSTNGVHSHGNSTGIAGAHNHTVDSQGDHSHTYVSPATAGPVSFSGGPFAVAGSAPTSTDGAHTHNVSYVDNHAHGIINDGAHTHTVSLGGSAQPFPLVQPVIVMTKIIYAGVQATTAVLAAAGAAPTQRRLSAPMRGSH